MNLTHIAIETPLGTRWVYQVPSAYAGTVEEVRTYGICCAARHEGRHEGRWQIHGTCTIHNQRYIEILDATPVLKA